MAGSQGTLIPDFSWNFHTAFYSDWINLHCHPQSGHIFVIYFNHTVTESIQEDMATQLESDKVQDTVLFTKFKKMILIKAFNSLTYLSIVI